MTLDLTGLRQELINLFLTYGVVPQGYDFDLWTKAENDTLNDRFESSGKTPEDFDSVVSRSVDDMLGLK